MPSTSPITELIAVTLDCSDASRLAHFYADLLGGSVTGEYPEYGYAQVEALGSTFNLQQVADFTRPTWPGQDQPQQFHLDLRVDDLDAAVTHAESLGASRAGEQPGQGWIVMLDPDGHPFCLCPPRES